ncbi:cell envelope biogenesis protein TonB [Bacteroidales bacterium]|nr:cell envelope biogenesis protein TonB [Bacteroidales bacterium]
MLFTYLTTVVSDEEEGILVSFGNVDLAAGTFEPASVGVDEVVSPEVIPTPAPPTVAPTEDPNLSQDLEASIQIEEQKKKRKEEARQEEIKRKVIEEERKTALALEKKKEEERKRQQAISNQVAGAFGAGTTSAANRGSESEGAGSQGSSEGTSSQGANSGTGGYGEFSLSGRSIGAGGLPRPVYTVQEEGRIVINITVDSKGNVIASAIGRGTNIDNASMRTSALNAAKKAKFNTIAGTNNQTGTITYRYFLK